jgi:flagellar basal-body rod modification protein FlgD
MYVNPVTSLLSSTGTAKTLDSTSMSGMNNDDFMVMLIAQLKHQNPMEPMDDKNLMGQVTQLNSLNELQTITARLDALMKSSQASYAASLIGKTVKVAPEGTNPFEGVVTGMALDNGEYVLEIGDTTASLASILEVREG